MDMQEKPPLDEQASSKPRTDHGARDDDGSSHRRPGGFDDIVTREVQVVQKRDARLARTFFLVTLLAVVLLVAAFFWHNHVLPGPHAVAPQSVLFKSERIAMPERPALEEPDETVAPAMPDTVPPVTVAKPAQSVTGQMTEVAASEESSTDVPPLPVRYTVTLGPFITKAGLRSGEDLLGGEKLLFTKGKGTGPVKLIRLQEGIYAPQIARKRLASLQKDGIRSSFVLPLGTQLAVYTGSFIDRERAETMTQELKAQGVEVSWVETQLMKEGALLILEDLPEAIALQLQQEFTSEGIHVQMETIE